METKSCLPIKEVIELDPVRQTIAIRMTNSLQNSAQFKLNERSKSDKSRISCLILIKLLSPF
ncbi:MAG: hypothetical protein ACP5I6_05795 [Caldisphaera sp.]|jgi:hypothetical protein